MQFIYIPGIFLAFFLSLLIITKKRKGINDYILSIWLLLISTHISLFYIENAYTLSENLILVNAAYPLLQGPCLFLYTYFLFNKNPFGFKFTFHFLPFIIALFLLLYFKNKVYGILILSIIVSGTVYIALTIRMMGSFKKSKEKYHQWLRTITYGLAVIWLIFILSGFVNHLLGLEPVQHEYISVAINIFVFSIGFLGLKEGYFLKETSIKPQYNSSTLTKRDLVKINEALDVLMQTEKLYLNPDLSMNDLSEKLKSPKHHLSQLFSTHLKTTYYDYINQLRINELKKLVNENELASKSLLGIAYDCGFKSKATFNRAFKKLCGQTPSEYIKSS